MTPPSPELKRSAALTARAGRGFLVAVALTFGFAAVLRLAPAFGAPVLIDIGPSTGRYGSGFEDSEETPPTTSRWTRGEAEFEAPLDVAPSHARFSVRAARYLDEPTRITVTVASQAVVDFEQPRGRQRIQEVEATLPQGPLRIGLRSADPNLGLALDWIRIDGAHWVVPVREWTVWILPSGLFLALMLAGMSMSGAGLAASTVLALLAVAAALDPFGFVHAMRDVSVPAILFSCLTAAFLRRGDITLAIAATLLLKGGMLFHPSYFYNDVRQSERFVGAIKTYEGGLLERATRAQIDLGVGYPRIIAGKRYAFPYSPIFYAPFTLLPHDRDLVVRALKHTALAGAALEVLMAFLIARKLAPEFAAAAAWFTFAFPIVTSRLMYSMYPTVVAHSLDLVMIFLAISVLERPEKRGRWLGATLAIASSLLAYVSSLFTVTAFSLAFAALAAKVRARFLVLSGALLTATVLGLYGRFTVTFVTEILPAVLGGGSRVETAAAEDTGNLVGAFARLPLFGGWGFPLLAVAGLLMLRTWKTEAATVVKAWAFAFLGLVVLRGISSGLLKDLKEVEFGGPVLAILAAVAVGALPSRTARFVVAGALIATGVFMQYGHFERWSRLVLG